MSYGDAASGQCLVPQTTAARHLIFKMSFDRQTAITGAELIAALYRNAIAPTINEASTDTQVLVQERNGGKWIIFPGSSSWTDWKTNFKVAKTSWHWGRVHSGDAAAFESIDEQLWRMIQPNERLTFIGHSLGGQLAMLGAARYADRVAAVYTFGAPRVGNGTFKRAYDAQLNEVTFRIENQDDGVPYLPPWILGYRHAGREVFLNDDGQIQVDRGLFSLAQTTALETVKAMQTRDPSKLVNVNAHGIGNYLKKLQQGTFA